MSLNYTNNPPSGILQLVLFPAKTKEKPLYTSPIIILIYKKPINAKKLNSRRVVNPDNHKVGGSAETVETPQISG